MITTRNLLNLSDFEDVLSGLAVLGRATGGGFSLYSLEANDQGCEELGILPDMLAGHQAIPQEKRGLNTNEILRACAEGEIKALWLVNCDPFEKHRDRNLVQRALENVDFLVYQGVLETEAILYASVVLPMTAPAESDGTFTSMEKRVQRISKILAPKGEAKDAWRIFQEVALRSKPSVPYFNAREIMEAISEEVPGYSAAVYEPPIPMPVPPTAEYTPRAETEEGVVAGT